MPHRCPSLDHRYKDYWWASHTVVVRSDYCPFLMSTKHPWSDRSRLIWYLGTQLNKVCKKAEDSTAAATAEEGQTHSAAHRCSVIPWNGCQGLEYPKQIQAELDKLCSQARRLACFWKKEKKFIFLDIQCLVHCCVSLCSVAVRHSCGLSIWWFIYVN